MKDIKDDIQEEVVALEESEGAAEQEAEAEIELDFGDEEVEIIDDDNAEEEAESESEQKQALAKKTKKPGKPVQPAAENAKYAAARKEAEQKQREAESKLNKILDAFGVKSYAELAALSPELSEVEKNELTKEATDTGENVEQLIERKQLKKLLELHNAKEAARVAELERDKEAKAKAAADLAEFKETFPNINADALFKDEDFMDYADGKIGRRTLVELYNSYMRLSNKSATAARYRADSRAERATGTGKTGEKVVITREQAIMLAQWNRDNPDMKMTAKEFLNRR